MAPTPRLHIRIPDDLRAAIERLAAANERSAGAEIRHALRQHLAAAGEQEARR